MSSSNFSRLKNATQLRSLLMRDASWFYTGMSKPLSLARHEGGTLCEAKVLKIFKKNMRDASWFHTVSKPLGGERERERGRGGSYSSFGLLFDLRAASSAG